MESPEDRRSLLQLARVAVRRYDLGPTRVSTLTNHWNAIYRVDTADGTRFALRISRPDWRDEADLRSELAWLSALRRDTDLLVPAPIPARGGDTLLSVATSRTPVPRYCALFTWVRGRRVERRASPRLSFLIGEAAAQLQNHADAFTPPACFTRRALNRASSSHDEGIFFSDEPHPLLSPRRRDVLRRAYARIQAALDALYREPPGPRFLHVDLHHRNVKLDGDRLAILDFDDSRWAYPIQDVAVALYALRTWQPGRPELVASFMRGYARHRAWPEDWDDRVETFIQHRMLDDLTMFLADPTDFGRRLAARLLELVERLFPEAAS